MLLISPNILELKIKMENNLQDELQKICKQIENNENYFKVNPIILWNFVNLQDCVPFQLYFQKVFTSITKNIYYKNYSILRTVKVPDTFDIIPKINNIIQIAEKVKDKPTNESKNPLLQNDKTEKDKTTTKTTFPEQSLFDMDEYTNPNELNKKIISYKNKIFSKIEKEIKNDKEKKILDFEDCNNFAGNSFENATIKYMFEVVNCFSATKDFDFYSNLKPNCKLIDKIFDIHKLPKIESIQIDFAIYNLSLADFLNVIIYFYNNIFNFKDLNHELFKGKENINLNDLKQMRDDPNSQYEKVDILGEIGLNVFNEDNKVKQLNKYDTLINNMNSLENNIIEYEAILNQLKIKKRGNKKLLLFLTDGSFINFMEYYKGNLNDKNEFVLSQKNIKTDSLLIYIKPTDNSRENYIISQIIYDYFSKKNKKNDDGINTYIQLLINSKKNKLLNSILSNKYEKFSKTLNQIEKSIKVNEIFKDYLKNKNVLLKDFRKQLIDFKMKLFSNLLIDTSKIDHYQVPKCKKAGDNFLVNIIIFEDKTLEIQDTLELKIEGLDIDIYHFYLDSFSVYSYDSTTHAQFLEKNKDEYERLQKRITNSVNIIVFISKNFKNARNNICLEYFCKGININFLSYLIVFHSTEETFSDIYGYQVETLFHKKHIIEYTFSDKVNLYIKKFINNNKNKIIQNYEFYSKEKDKYNYIISTYKTYCNDIYFDFGLGEIKCEENLRDIFKSQVILLENKIKQDIIFFFTLSLKKNPDLENFININFDENKELKDYLNNNKEIKGIKNTLNSLMKTITEDKNDLIIKEDDIQSLKKNYEEYSKELKNINNFKFVNTEHDKNESQDKEQKKNSSNSSISIHIGESNMNKIVSSDSIINVDTFIENFIDNIISEISFLKLRIYYNMFEKVITGSLMNKYLCHLSKKIIDKEIN